MYKLVAAILLGNGVGGRMATASHYNNFDAFIFSVEFTKKLKFAYQLKIMVLSLHMQETGNCSKNSYRGADKSLARATIECILFDGWNISFDASLVMYINSTNIPLIMIINRVYETQNLLPL